ncbi:hypothetical protein SPBR_07719 [Sporothrix brasiliensis 5110]|uniref:Protein kinase domain-containing protein n=1 Tax=Sporothrix brasiliensis 5110 TaxID=1398154 RepID=A0A0C2ISB4_9PEZI|nr:uncharacterized protein SPBR_07719 [Sporothrix brasiliensis 5110]KIH89745.1 hypothetical protein SPBR_07719 [Sporothrix brasiliensis 5110]
MGRRDSDSEEYVEPGTYPRMIQFRLGLSRIHAKADLFHTVFPHVLDLTIVPRRWYGLVRRCTAWLPMSFQAVVRRLWPGAFLPSRVVLKKLSRPTECRTELFDNEIAMYKHLHALQGKIIPEFYGEGSIREDNGERKRAIVLSVVDGVVANFQAVPIPMEEFKRRLGVAHGEMLRHGVAYDDVQLNNVILQEDESGGNGDGRIVFVDLEHAFLSEPEHAERRAINLIMDYGYRYRDCLKNWENRQRDGYRYRDFLKNWENRQRDGW